MPEPWDSPGIDKSGDMFADRPPEFEEWPPFLWPPFLWPPFLRS